MIRYFYFNNMLLYSNYIVIIQYYIVIIIIIRFIKILLLLCKNVSCRYAKKCFDCYRAYLFGNKFADIAKYKNIKSKRQKKNSIRYITCSLLALPFLQYNKFYIRRYIVHIAVKHTRSQTLFRNRDMFTSHKLLV